MSRRPKQPPPSDVSEALDAVAEKLPVIALDLPGHGQSTSTLPGTSIKALATFVARFMEAIDVPQAHLVGHSMGGAVAARLALDAPPRVASFLIPKLSR